MATLLKRLLPGIKQFLAKLEERLFLTTTQPSATGLHPTSRNGAAHNGRRNGATATVPQDTATLSQASQAERDSYWKNQPHTSAREQLQEWERLIDSFIAELHADPATWEQYAFLQRLLAEDTNGQAQAPVAVSAQAIYHTFFTGEGNGDLEYFFQRIVRTNTVEQIHRNQELIENLAKMYGEETATHALPRIAALTTGHHHRNGHNTPDGAPLDASRHFFSLGADEQTGHEVCLTQHALRHSAFFLGQAGMGKSNTLLHLARYHMEQGHGLILIEPHGQLSRDVIASIPDDRLDDVILLDLMDCGTAPFGLNVFECDDPGNSTEIAKIASAVFHIFEKTWLMSSATPLLAQVVRHICYTMIETGLTLGEVPLLLWDDAVREKITATLSNARTRQFWEQYTKMTPTGRREYTNSTTNKLDAFLTQPLLANILCQQRSTINLRQITDDGRILLLHLNQQFEEASRLVGIIVLTKLLLSAFSRAETSEECRRPFAVLCDEWQVFCASSSDFARFVHEGRKWNFMPCYANQSLSQLTEENMGAAMSAGTLAVMRINGDDARVVARSFDATPQPVEVGLEPQRAVAADPLSHLVSRGHQDPRVARFAQTVLHNLEYFHKTPSSPSVAYVKSWHASYNCFDRSLSLSDWQVQEGRKLLNQTLYACMSEANPNLSIPMLAIYILAAAQRDGREYVFSPHIKHYNHGFIFGPFSLEAFEESARKFGEAWFVEPQRAAGYIASVAKYAKKEQWMAEAVVSMLTELRYVLSVLAQSPILIDTGHMVPKYQLRTYQDQQNSVANSLGQQPPFTARIKTLHGEFTVRLKRPPELMPEELVQERIYHIKQRMRERGVTKSAGEVIEEIRKRHEHLRQRPHSDAPPPASTTGRPPRRLRQKPPPAFT